MNLIVCSKNCVHQQDGFCRLERAAAPTGSAVDGCCYYRAPERRGQQNAPRKKR